MTYLYFDSLISLAFLITPSAIKASISSKMSASDCYLCSNFLSILPNSLYLLHIDAKVIKICIYSSSEKGIYWPVASSITILAAHSPIDTDPLLILSSKETK
jgi:hypothetical protein